MGKKVVIVCNGSVNTKFLYTTIQKNDFIVCADGGANKLIKTKFTPDVIIGDMDSVTKSTLKKFRKAKLIKFQREKDQVDLELAINYCVKRKFKEILILGAFGNRADMSLTNVFVLLQIPKKIQAKIIHQNQEIYLVQNKSSIKGIPDEKISFFPIKGDVKGLTLTGLKYEVKNYDLRFGTGKGLSNQFKNKNAVISFKDGLLVCVHFRSWF